MNALVTRRNLFLVSLALVVAVTVIYRQTLGHGFVLFDDPAYVSENPTVKGGLTAQSLTWAFTCTDLANWHPLTWLSHQLDATLYGANPAGHHLTNLLLHAANAILLLLLLVRFTGRLWPAAAVAALFAVHPLHVESVAWISERKDVLSTFFAFLTLLAYERYTRQRELRRYLAVVVLFALGLLAKPMLVTLPCVLLLLDFWPLGRFQFGGTTSGRRNLDLVIEKLPLFAMAAASAAMTVFAQRHGGAMVGLQALPLADRLGNAALAYVLYLEKAVLPVKLAAFYPYLFDEQPALAAAGAAALLLLAVTALAIWQMRRRPWLAVGWFWYLGTLVPVIGLVQVGSQALADRYTYIPLVGIFIIFAWAGEELASTFHSSAARLALAVMGATALLVLTMAAWAQARYWRDTDTLFRHAVAVTGPNALAHTVLGTALERQGRDREALPHFAEALRLMPKHPQTNTDMGFILEKLGEYEAAAKQYASALRRNPDMFRAHTGMAGVLAHLGQPAAALEHAEAALRTLPDRADAHYNLGNVFSALGRLPEAIREYRAALRRNPGYVEAHINLGTVLAQAGDTAGALEQYQAALELRPEDANIYGNAGNLLLRQGDVGAAQALFAEALRLAPANPQAQLNAGIVLAVQGQADQALPYFREALRLQPDDPGTLFALAAATEKKGEFAEAIARYREALKYRPDWPQAMQSLAWLLATDPDRDAAAEALTLARRARELTAAPTVEILDTLAAACARAGKFEDAVKAAQEAVTLADAGGRKELAAAVRQRLDAYGQGKPWLRPAPAGSPPQP